MLDASILTKSNIKEKIRTIRNIQVILDEDLAILYEVPTKKLNEQVKRNIERFPDTFMFQLTKEETAHLRSQTITLNNIQEVNMNLRSQFATSNNKQKNYRRYLPYAFTEQGVAMLSGILRSKTAINVSIHIMNAFVSMRKFIAENADIFYRLDHMERKQLEHDKNFIEIFDFIQTKNIVPDKGIFFEGQIFDAYKFVANIIKKAEKSIILIDNYVDESVFTLLTKRKSKVQVTIYTKEINKQLALDLEKHNAQYKTQKIEVKLFEQSHDRFIIVDDTEIYHIGASLKDLGKKWFAFSKFDKETIDVLKRLEKM